MRDGVTSRHDGPFTVDTLAPSQWRALMVSSHHNTGTHRLLLAVLQDAFNILMKYRSEVTRPHPKPKVRALYDETHLWVASDDPEYAFSFVSICEALDLDSTVIRRGLAALPVPAQLPKAPPVVVTHGGPVSHTFAAGVVAVRAQLAIAQRFLSTRELVERLPSDGSYQSVYNACVYGVRRGTLLHVGKSEWGLPEWLPQAVAR